MRTAAIRSTGDHEAFGLRSAEYSRSLRLLVDEVGMSWVDALARCMLGPARIVEQSEGP